MTIKADKEGFITFKPIYELARQLFINDLLERRLTGQEIISVIASNRNELKLIERY